MGTILRSNNLVLGIGNNPVRESGGHSVFGCFERIFVSRIFMIKT